MAKVLVQVVTGPENPTRAALGLLIAKTAAAEGHEVQLFLAGDAVDFIRPETALAAHGVGTGSVAEHLEAIRESGVPIALSAMSCKARGIDDADAADVEMALPPRLVELSTGADTVLIY
jgi:predicted peroxiredoxin